MANPSMMVAFHCFTDATFVAACKNFVTMATGRLGSSWSDTITLLDPETPSFVQEFGTYLLYKPSYSHFYAVIVNFLSVGGQFE